MPTFSCELEMPPDGIISSNPAPSLRSRPCSALHSTREHRDAPYVGQYIANAEQYRRSR